MSSVEKITVLLPILLKMTYQHKFGPTLRGHNSKARDRCLTEQ